MNTQLTHHSSPFVSRKHEIIMMCDGLSSPANTGGLFRIAEAFGVKQIVFYNSQPNLNSSRLRKTARNTEKRVPFAVFEDLQVALSTFREEGYLLLGLEITSESKPIQNIKVAPDTKVLLILGNEANGISNEALKIVDACVHIELFGSNSSINVTQAAAIALFELTRT
ncbi:MAG: TrmH family RNA methyltransferase [Flavobacteriaceae bacterium]|nr:TrmH family RNA methyltransferase [Flavobacteriaceae bacterium]